MDLKSSPTIQGGGAAPSAGDIGVLQLEALCLSSIDSNSEQAVQPFPRSPKLLRKLAKAIQPSTDDLAARVHELQAERSKAEAHIKSLKKRKADLSRSAELMKQQVREHFEEMRASLRADERVTLDSLEQDLRRTGERLDQVTRGWEQHLGQVGRAAGAAQRALRSSGEGEDAGPQGDVEPGPPENQRFKKPDASEAKIRLNEGRFKRLLRALHGVSRELRAQLPRKALLLDSVAVTFDRHTCHPSLSVTGDGRGLGLQAPGAAAPPDQHPLRFDRVFCALASVALATGQSYWEVDVRCCDGDGDGDGGWAVGVAYACLPRKGRDKGAKLGRNRHSWCVEWREGQLAAWHNDRSVALGVRARPVGRVGVWVNHDKGQLLFYDAGSMELLQAFSAAMTPVFDRARHQFIEPLFPAVRLLEPQGATARPWANHVEICDLAAL